MSVFIYKNGHWDCLAGNRIWSSQHQEWVKVKDGDQLRFNSRWHTISTNAWTSENNCKKTNPVTLNGITYCWVINDGKIVARISNVGREYEYEYEEVTCLGGILDYVANNREEYHLFFIANKRLRSYGINSHLCVLIGKENYKHVSGGDDDFSYRFDCCYALTEDNKLHCFDIKVGILNKEIPIDESTGLSDDEIDWTEVTGHWTKPSLHYINGRLTTIGIVAFAVGDGKLYMLYSNKYHLLDGNVGWSSLSGCCIYKPSDLNVMEPVTIVQYARAKYNDRWYKIGVNVVIPEEE